VNAASDDRELAADLAELWRHRQKHAENRDGNGGGFFSRVGRKIFRPYFFVLIGSKWCPTSIRGRRPVRHYRELGRRGARLEHALYRRIDGNADGLLFALGRSHDDFVDRRGAKLDLEYSHVKTP
jgi:hypothetical protein